MIGLSRLTPNERACWAGEDHPGHLGWRFEGAILEESSTLIRACIPDRKVLSAADGALVAPKWPSTSQQTSGDSTAKTSSPANRGPTEMTPQLRTAGHQTQKQANGTGS